MKEQINIFSVEITNVIITMLNFNFRYVNVGCSLCILICLFSVVGISSKLSCTSFQWCVFTVVLL